MPVNLQLPLIGPLRVGSRGDAVRVVQARLNELRDPAHGNGAMGQIAAILGGPGASRFARIVADGAFGGKTETSVIHFQKLRQLRADGVVGPLTAKAMGFSNYTSLRRIAMGAAQLASAVTGSLARMIPAPHAEQDLIYNALLALSVHADVLHRVLRVLENIPGAAGIMRELDLIVGELRVQLIFALQLRMAKRSVAQLKAHQDSLHARLLALSRRLHSLAAPEQGSMSLVVIALQSKMLGTHGLVMGGVTASLPHTDPADELLKIAATVLKSANDLLPKM